MAAAHVTFTSYDDGRDPEAMFFSDDEPHRVLLVLDQDEEELINQLVVRMMLRSVGRVDAAPH